MTAAEQDRTLSVPGLSNARHLGGLPLERGSTTPSGSFVRSERPSRVLPEGWSQLHRLGVRAVLDLRQERERAAAPGGAPSAFADLHVDHDGPAHEEFWADHRDLRSVVTPLHYLPHLAALPGRTVAVLSAIATAPPGGVLVHCTGGRDRTGMIAAILLRAAGVRTEAIIADYLTSIANADGVAAGLGRANEEADVAELLANRGTTSEAAFRAFLAGLDVGALLGRLPPEQARAIRTWRGALPAASA